MKSISKPTYISVSETLIKSTGSVQHWLLSLFLHFILISVFVFLTIHSKNQKTPTWTLETVYVVFMEIESQEKNPTASAAQGLEQRAHHDKPNEIIAVNQPSLGDETNQNRPKTFVDGILPNDQPQKFAIKETKELKKLSASEQNLLSPVLDRVPDVKKFVELNADRLRVNDSYTEFLTRIEQQTAKLDLKPLTVKTGFSSVSRKSLQDNGGKNNSIPNAKGPASSCYVGVLGRQAPLSDEMPPGHYFKLGSNQAIRISDLVGHGRYVQTSRSVRVSDLLSVGSQLQHVGHPNASVTVSDLLRQRGHGFQSFCQ